MKKIYFFVLLLMGILTAAMAQGLQVSFECQYQNGNSLLLDSVQIKNQTRNWMMTVYYPNLTISLGDATNGITEVEFDNEGLARTIPNPFNGHTHAQLSLLNNEYIIMRIFDVAGKNVAYYEGQLTAGEHDFDLVLSTPQTYILQVKTTRKTYAIKMVNTGNGGEDKISLKASNNEVVPKSAKQIMDYDFEVGDLMYYQGFVTIDNEIVATEAITQNQYVSELITFTIHTTLPTVTTNMVSNITEISAICGGNVISTGGSSITARGVCWSTSQNPTISDNHTSDGSGTGSFNSNITGLTPVTTYYVRAYAINSVGTAYGNQLHFTTPSCDAQPCPGATTVTDIDNNTYNTVQIGTQCWMKENLRTTRYSNGTSIALGSSTSTTTAYRYYPNNDQSNVSTYGYLYNWKAVMGSSSSSSANPSGVQGICPTGWHVPSDAEWTQLTDYVRSQSQYVCDGLRIAKALASTTGWNSYTDACAVGNNPSSNNATGFSALPAGHYGSNYYFFGDRAVFWSATENGDDGACNLCLMYNAAYVVRGDNGKAPGFSVRCVRDESESSTTQLPTVTTTAVNNVTANTATCGGNVTSDGGATVTSRGVCWSTSQNPTVSDNHTSDGSGTGSFISNITGLTAGTTYYVRAYVTNSQGTAYGNELSFTTVAVYGQPCSGAATVTDIDNNTYNTVQIGNQCWMKENLRTTRYANGTSIPLGSTYSYTNPYRYAPDNNSSNVSTYGYLYNWPAVMHGASFSSANPSGVQGVCPTGWHVPSNAEWTQLTNYVSSQSQCVCGSNSTYIAKALASTTGWDSSTSTCAVGNTPTSNNATGFSALPAGNYYGYYGSFGSDACFWSATELTYVDAYSHHLYYGTAEMGNGNGDKDFGFSVRCVRGESEPSTSQLPIVTTTAVNYVTATTATCGGNVTSDGGGTVTAIGVCWSTSQNPTTSNNHTHFEVGNLTGTFTSNITDLREGTTYYVRAYAINSAGTAYGNEVSFTTMQYGQPCPGMATVTDYDGNIYNTVQIGNQCWMKENLRTTHYANGTSLSIGYSNYPNGRLSNVPTYGYLYSWHQVMINSTASNTNPSGVQGICPTGWHVPSVAEWIQLTDYVSSQSQYVCGSNSTHIAKALASTTTWLSSSETCAVGNNPSANNATGFSALPAGSYSPFGNGGFPIHSGFIESACFWSTTEGGTTGSGLATALGRGLSYDYSDVSYSYGTQNGGKFSVRCVRDEPTTVTTTTVNNVTSTTATCGGNVTSDGGATITARGVCWSTSQNPTISGIHTSDGTGTGSFTSNITGLAAGTTYYVRAYATISVGIVYGNEVSFTTLPTVTTSAVSNITSNSAICGGNVTVAGNATVISRGVCWSTSENPTVNDSHTTDGSGTGSFTSNLTGLMEATTYYVRAYATNSYGTSYGEEKSFMTPFVSDGQPCYGSSTVTDYDGNTYNTVQIGTQCWMKENLRTTHYSNGTSIALGSSTCTSTTTAYRYCPANASLVSTYGYLYNGKAVMGGSSSSSANPSGVQGICPTGWHVPSDAEWTQLTDYVSSQIQYACGDYNTNIAKALASTIGWNSSSNTCAVGNNPNANNVTGFSILPAGGYFADYVQSGLGKYAYFWSATSSFRRYFCYDRANVGRDTYSNGYGFSVRCVRDAPTTLLPTVTTAVNNVTSITATCGGNVTSDGGATVTTRGVCWSTSQNPTISNNHTTDGNGIGSFTNNIAGLYPNTTYYVRAYATNSVGTAYGNELSFITVATFDGQPCPGTATVTDVDNNTYNTVQIGNQCWMKENLRTTRYANGSCIPLGSTFSFTDPYRYYPNNDQSNVFSYGYLYNWAAVMDSSNSSSANPSGVQGICPTGWHVPSAAEWTQLTDYVNRQSQYVCGNGYIAKALAFTMGWSSSSNTCAVGNNPSSNNTTGFSALPAGYYNGNYAIFGNYAAFWSATESNVNCTKYRRLKYDFADVSWTDAYKCYGHSVRCVRDESGSSTTQLPTIITTALNNVTATTVTCGGSVTSDGGTTVISRGVCWDTSQNPTISDSHTTDGNGTGSFTSNITGLQSNTTYYVCAYATNSQGTAYGNEVSFTTTGSTTHDGQSCPGMATVTDIDNNTYNTVQIGNQCWMRENLRTTRYYNGTSIALGSSTSTTTAYRYYPDNNSSNVSAYGYLYNWKAVMGNSSSSSANPSGVQGICPTGWHVPSDAEWTQLTDYVSSQNQYVCGGDNTYIAKALASTIGWNSSSNTCAVGNSPTSNNATGLSALPAGYYNGTYNYFGCSAVFWSTTEGIDDDAYYHGVFYGTANVDRYYHSKYFGFSVRCTRDEGVFPTTQLPTITTTAVNNVTTTTATCGGNVTSDGGATVTSRGVCWSTSQNPTISDSHTTDGNGTGNFTSNITGLQPNTTYYIRAYATNSQGTAYGSQVVFTTTNSGAEHCYLLNEDFDNGAIPTGWTIIDNDADGYEWNHSSSISTSILGHNESSGCMMSASYVNNVGALTPDNWLITPAITIPNNISASLSFWLCAQDAVYAAEHYGVYITTSSDYTNINNYSLLFQETIDANGGSRTQGTWKQKTAVLQGYAGQTVHIAFRHFNCTDMYYLNIDDVTVQYDCSGGTSGTDGQPCPGAATVTDIDNNTYNTVQIGNQCWMKENLRTTRYFNGSSIALGSSTSTTTAYRYYPNNDQSNVSTYGYLYNWKAVMGSSSSSSANPSGAQGICPTGWHVPSDAEWTQLTDYVGSQNQYVCGSNSTCIAKALASTTGWNSSTSTCAVGNTPTSNNATGFSALPAGGHYDFYGSFGEGTYFWSATEYNVIDANCPNLFYYYGGVYRSITNKGNGFSVRCVRD